MTRIRVAALAVAMTLAVSLPARTQNGAKLEDLKREAIREVESLRVLTKQMVDQIFSYGEQIGRASCRERVCQYV